jgi:hypothetical protein
VPARASDLDAYLGELTKRLEAVRGLELVLYPLQAVQVATSDPGFDLNLRWDAS